MSGPLRTAVSAVALIAALALTATLPAACGVDFDPDRFCWKCSVDDDCGDAYVCRVEGKVGHCIPADLSADESTPCDPAEPPPGE